MIKEERTHTTVSESKVVDERMSGVYVVNKRGAIHWPDGKLRGEEGYVVRGDDPFMKRYFRASGTPAMLIRDDSSTPVPPDEWPARYRTLAGREYMSKLELIERVSAEREERERNESMESRKGKIKDKVSKEIPDLDED